MTTPFAHVAGLPLEETLPALLSAACALALAARATLVRASRQLWRRRPRGAPARRSSARPSCIGAPTHGETPLTLPACAAASATPPRWRPSPSAAVSLETSGVPRGDPLTAFRAQARASTVARRRFPKPRGASGKETRGDGGTFGPAFSPPLTRESHSHTGFRFPEWRDPDSNRGHHDFQVPPRAMCFAQEALQILRKRLREQFASVSRSFRSFRARSGHVSGHVSRTTSLSWPRGRARIASGDAPRPAARDRR